MTEEWRPISGYEGLYEVSSTGKVRNCRIGSPNYHRELTQQPNGKKGVAKYISIGLWKHNQPKYKYLHRIVAEAFIPNPDSRPSVNHKDCNPLNNCVTNLEWVTHQENMDHAVAHDRLRPPDSELSRANLKIAQDRQNIFNRRSDGVVFSSCAAAGRALEVSADTIRNAIKYNRIVKEYTFLQITKEEYYNECEH